MIKLKLSKKKINKSKKTKLLRKRNLRKSLKGGENPKKKSMINNTNPFHPKYNKYTNKVQNPVYEEPVPVPIKRQLNKSNPFHIIHSPLPVPKIPINRNNEHIYETVH